MNTATRILKYLLIVMLVLLLGSAAGWYFYLRSQQSPLAHVTDTGTAGGGFQGNRGDASAAAGGSATSTNAVDQTAPKPIEKLWRVDQGPVAGFSFVGVASSTIASSTAPLFFAERANGYLFSANTATQIITRITNTLMPKTYEAYFGSSGKYVLLRSIDDSGALTTFAGTFLIDNASSTPQALTGVFLAPNIREVALDSLSKNIFVLFNDANGGSSGTVELQDGTKQKKLFSSFIRSWQPFYTKAGLVVVTKPSDNLPGYAYKVSATGSFTPIVGPMPGLSIVPHPTQDAILYSASTATGIALFVQSGKTAAIQVSLQTIADKCVWAPGKALIVYCAVPSKISSSSFMNDWYRGALHTEDSWWKIDATSGDTELVYTPKQSLDVHDPVIDSTGTYLAFTNGSDQSLWMLSIVQ